MHFLSIVVQSNYLSVVSQNMKLFDLILLEKFVPEFNYQFRDILHEAIYCSQIFLIEPQFSPPTVHILV